MMEPNDWYIGIDAGGTKTELLAGRRGKAPTIRLLGKGANLQRVGPQRAAQTLGGLVEEFLEGGGELGNASGETKNGGGSLPDAIPRRVGSLCAGIAGAGRPDEQRAIEKQLCKYLGDNCPSSLRIVHDAEIALEAAFEGESGVIIITGTGSIVLARAEDGALLRAGGWGYLLGDDGSGFTLGRRGLRSVAAYYDGGPETQLCKRVAETFGIDSSEDLIQSVYSEKLSIAAVAPLVIAAATDGDEVSEAIVRDVIQALTTQVSWLIKRADSIDHQVALLGGLTNETYYRDRLSKALRGRFDGWTIGAPRHRPVVGALRLAQQMAGVAAYGD